MISERKGISEKSTQPDKFKATWVSHSSISDFLKCQRLYYLRNVYKDPVSGNKITITKPPLALGQAVHEVIEGLSLLPSKDRFSTSLLEKFDASWEKVSGKIGGFRTKEEEDRYKERGRQMLGRIVKNPGPLARKAIKIRSDGGLPYFWLSSEDNIILCGKIDWLEYNDKDDSVNILDFKTGKNEESEDSFQLPIYYLLAKRLQKRKIGKLSYWYLDRDDEAVQMRLPDEKGAFEKVYEVARRIKLGRSINHLKCKTNGCYACHDLEQIIKGKGEKVGVNQYRQDIYIL